MGTLKRFTFDLYRWRYSLGYFGVSVVFVALMGIAAFFAPQGITDAEKSSTVMSNLLSYHNFTPDMVVNLPYHMLQKIGFYFFGVTEFTIKLPSLILASLAGIGILLLLKQWFRRNTAVLSGLLAFTTGPFLLIAQAGTPAILHIFWPIVLLVSGSMISTKAKYLFFWKLLFFGSLALSLYTPLTIYIVLALIVVAMLHPHLRYLINRLSRGKVILAIVLSLFLLAPLLYGLYIQPQIGLTLLGIPKNSINLLDNLSQLARMYLDVMHPTNGRFMTPVYGIASLVLIALGIYRIATTKYTAKSYVLLAWLILLIPIMLISPTLTSMTFTPFMLLMAFGVGQLIKSWYGLFPRNPYARAAGLLPLVIFIASLTLSGVDRFMYGYRYSPSAATIYSRDLSVLGRELSTNRQTNTLRVAPSEEPFYLAVSHYNTSWKIDAVVTTQASNKSAVTIVSRRAHTPTLGQPTKILVSSLSNDADRFYLYKNPSL